MPAMDVAPDARIGTAFAGRYRIIRLLGQGDRKQTYLAEDTVLNRRVALALIKPGAAKADPEGTRREVEMLSQAGDHGNIVTLHDQGTAEGTDYLVFAYLAGGTLRSYLDKRKNREKPLSADDIMRFGRQLARALSHLHGLKVVHRDIAPANIWLDEHQVAHLGDFDSAIRLDAPQDLAELPPTTEAYAAPEQVAGQDVDHRSDLYSLGAVLYEAATGELPDRENPGKTAKRLALLRPDIPRSLNATICGLLEESPSERSVHAANLMQTPRGSRKSRRVDEGVLAWAETLPFPLASILWHYEGEPDLSTKLDHLLQFFEALAQFAATVVLSAFRSDRALFDANRYTWFGQRENERGDLDLCRTSFGTWVELLDRLAETYRGLLENQNGGADRCYELFAASDADLVEAFTSLDITKILLHARDCRNSWSGHGGIAGPALYRERLGELEGLLSRTRGLLGWSFETWTLLRPGAATYIRGVYDLTATILTGPNPTFRRKQIQVEEPLDASRLYLLNDGSTRALALVPLIRVMAGSKTGQDACYFFNRLQGSEVRWVSYHFHAEPEIVLPDPDVLELLEDMSPVLS
jgi:serine/threonine protein kinase